MTTIENDQRLTQAILTQGVLDGLRMRPVAPGTLQGDGGAIIVGSEDHVVVGPDNYGVVVGPGSGLDHVGRLVTVSVETTIDLGHLVDGTDGVVGHLYIEPGTDRPSFTTEPIATTTPIDPFAGITPALGSDLHLSHQVAPQPVPGLEPDIASTPATIRVIRSGDPIPRSAVPIASVRLDRESAILTLSNIHAWLTSNGMLIGSPNSGGLAVTDDAIVAGRVLHLVGGGRDGAGLEHHVVVGPRRGPNLALGGDRLAASTDGVQTDLHIQSDGGEVHFGGPVRGPEWEPLTVLGGSDVSLSGGGVLMIGERTGANLVLDENEIMAREDGANAPLLLQWEGGDTRFGGVIRGPADGPLNILGGNDLSLGGHGLLTIGPPEAAHLLLDENEIMARAGDHSSNLYLQWQGGETHFGGPIELTSATPDERVESWRIEACDGGRLAVIHDGVPHCWFEPSTGVMFSGSEFSHPGGSRPEADNGERLGSSSGFLRTDVGAAEVAESTEQLDRAVSVLRKLRPLRSQPISEDTAPSVGFDPAEVAAVAPELAARHRGVGGIDHSGLLTYAVAAIQEQQRTIDRLERRVNALESERAPV